jgi:hypothetical protein
VEFVASAGEAPQAHALEAVVGLQVRKAHLDLLAARFIKFRRTRQGACLIAGFLVDVTSDLAQGRVWTALRLEWTCSATHNAVAACVARGLDTP